MKYRYKPKTAQTPVFSQEPGSRHPVLMFSSAFVHVVGMKEEAKIIEIPKTAEEQKLLEAQS